MLAFSGLIAGFVNGFFGTGGGIVIFFSLMLLGSDVRRALASANFGILVLSIVSFFVYLKLGTVDAGDGEKLLRTCLLPALTGGALGAWLSGNISPKILKKIFSALVIVCGVRTVLS